MIENKIVKCLYIRATPQKNERFSKLENIYATIANLLEYKIYKIFQLLDFENLIKYLYEGG